MALAGDPEAFRVSLADWANRVGINADALARQACQETAFRVVNATPVHLGFLRGGWQPGLNTEPAAGGDVAADPGGAIALASIGAIIGTMKAGDVFHMRNNTVYARRIEFGFVGQDSLGRNYNQKGQYFVTNVVASWSAIVEEVAAALSVGATP